METEAKMQKISLVSIGERLKKARESKSVTIDQVQRQTRIHSTVISSLEDGSCDNTMTPAYVKSFLKTYSTYLGLDPKELLKEYAVIHPPENHFAPMQSAELDAGRPDTMSKFIYAVSFVVIIAAILFFTAIVWKKVAPTLKKARSAKSTSIKKTPRLPARVSSQSKRTEAAGNFTAISIPRNQKLNLVLKIRQQVRIQLRKDGILLFDTVMAKNTVKAVTAENKFDLFIAKAEAVELTINGKSYGIPGRGVIKDLEITRTGIRIK